MKDVDCTYRSTNRNLKTYIYKRRREKWSADTLVNLFNEGTTQISVSPFTSHGLPHFHCLSRKMYRSHNSSDLPPICQPGLSLGQICSKNGTWVVGVMVDRYHCPLKSGESRFLTAALTRLKQVWNDRSISLSSCAPFSHPSSCMLVNHAPSQQSSKEEYKPRK